MKLDLPGPATSVSISPDSSRAIVAGRDMLRLVSVSDEGIEDALNLTQCTAFQRCIKNPEFCFRFFCVLSHGRKKQSG